MIQERFVSAYKRQLLTAIESVDATLVDRAVSWFEDARDANRQVFVCGNGGSASTASHFVCDVVKGGASAGGKRFRILALNDNIATLTAYSNDVSYEAVFVEQLKNFVNRGDLFMALSGSGNSGNVVRAMEHANAVGCRTIALTGRDGGKLGPLAGLHINVAEQHMGRIEDAHMMICHMIAYALMDGRMGLPPTPSRGVLKVTSRP
jgi:D-sedoheptulose 7-phosphate isomerase